MKVLIELEFNDYDNENLSDDYVKESVYTYLKELINDDNLDYTIEG
tara:strand:+ start:54 stop:191 length:138 start_codon:yes stop_codon:yes gene_type:complete